MKKMCLQKREMIKLDLIKRKNYIGRKNLSDRGLDPSMFFFALGNRKTFSIIDYTKGFNRLLRALCLIFSIIEKNGHLCIVNTDPELSIVIDNLLKGKSKSKNISYCNIKWVGGTLTNWYQVSKGVLNFARSSGSIDENYFRRNKKKKIRRYIKMKKSFQGFVGKQNERPDLLFVLDPNNNQHIINEGVRLNIPVIAITDSNSKISGITHPIPANKDSTEFIRLLLSWIIRFIRVIHPLKVKISKSWLNNKKSLKKKK